jgi:hypothetical protein
MKTNSNQPGQDIDRTGMKTTLTIERQRRTEFNVSIDRTEDDQLRRLRLERKRHT